MTVEISPALIEVVVAVSRKAVDDRMAETSVTRKDFAEVKTALRGLTAAQTRTEKRVDRLEAAIADLAAAQVRTEQRVEELAAAQARTEQRVEELAAAQARTEQRVGRLEQAIEELAAAQARTEQRMGGLEAEMANLAAAQARTEAALKELAATTARLQVTVGDLQGWRLESQYRDKAFAYLGRLLRRVRVVPLQEIESQLESHLSDQEMEDLTPLDLLVRGQPRRQPDAPEVWLAMEISAVVDRNDVARARQRAAALRKAGYLAIPTVAGQQVTQGAEAAAQTDAVLLLQDGRIQFWEQALAAAMEG